MNSLVFISNFIYFRNRCLYNFCEAYPYGIEAFDSVLRPLFKGIMVHRGKGLAAFLKAIGFIIPLMVLFIFL